MHSMVLDFLSFIDNHTDDEVARRFNMPKEISEELREIVVDYFGEWRKIVPADIRDIEKSRENKPIFNVFSMNQPNRYGLDCVLLDASGNETELIFHAEFFLANEEYKMTYKYIGS